MGEIAPIEALVEIELNRQHTPVFDHSKPYIGSESSYIGSEAPYAGHQVFSDDFAAFINEYGPRSGYQLPIVTEESGSVYRGGSTSVEVDLEERASVYTKPIETPGNSGYNPQEAKDKNYTPASDEGRISKWYRNIADVVKK
ncbi:hypothetical protein ACFLZX_06355, partial [Nanoarchaeota archaeon]